MASPVFRPARRVTSMFKVTTIADSLVTYSVDLWKLHILCILMHEKRLSQSSMKLLTMPRWTRPRMAFTNSCEIEPMNSPLVSTWNSVDQRREFRLLITSRAPSTFLSRSWPGALLLCCRKKNTSTTIKVYL